MLHFLLKLSDLKSNFALTLGYLNPALNTPALVTNENKSEKLSLSTENMLINECYMYLLKAHNVG